MAQSSSHERVLYEELPDMSIVAVPGSGAMATALSVPLADNGQKVRLVGTYLDSAIIEGIRETGVHLGLNLRVPESARACQLEEAAYRSLGGETIALQTFGTSAPPKDVIKGFGFTRERVVAAANDQLARDWEAT